MEESDSFGARGIALAGEYALQKVRELWAQRWAAKNGVRLPAKEPPLAPVAEAL